MVTTITCDGGILCELRNIESVCIQPISLLNELVAEGDEEFPQLQSYVKVSDLEVAFKLLLERGKHHNCKEKIVLPMRVDGKIVFHSNNPKVPSNALVVCNICSPPMVISKEGYTQVENQRALRCHNAIHQLTTPGILKTNEPCPFCLGNCHAVVDLTSRQKKKVESGEEVPPKANVRPNCATHGGVLGNVFAYKTLKPTKQHFPCSNKLVFCNLCKDFIWSYNLKSHYCHIHSGRDMPNVLKESLPADDELDKLSKLFKVNGSN